MRGIKKLLAPLLLAGALVLPDGALAASVPAVAFADVQAHLVAQGTLDGLDPALGTQVNLTMAGYATVVCVGPGNQLEVRAGVPVSTGGPAHRLAAGETEFSVQTYAPTVLPATAGCHQNSRFVIVTDVDFSRAVVTVIQNGAVQMFGYRNADGAWTPA